tara:strand:+ start:24 stop:1004 length:981 start_codon:yes stop_codon:yes gene_type:complete
MSKKKVWITDYFNEASLEKSILGDVVSFEPHEDIEVIIVWHKKVDKKLIDSFPKLKGIVRYGVGYDNVDFNYAIKKSIPVCNNPDYGVEEVADTAMAMIMSVSRGINEYNYNAKFLSDSWKKNTLSRIERISNLNLGLIGIGRIGGNVAIKSNAMNFNVHFYDPYVPQGFDKLFNSKRHDSLESLLKVCDIISIHCPLTNETEGMINKEFINLMKDHSSLVNVSRGKIINNLDDFYQPLKSNKISCLYLDVTPEEPPKGALIDSWKNQEKWLGDRLIINPHSAYYSKTSYDELRLNAAKMAKLIIENKKLINVINNGINFRNRPSS